MFIDLYDAINNQKKVLIQIIKNGGSITESHIETVFDNLADQVKNAEGQFIRNCPTSRPSEIGEARQLIGRNVS